MNALNFVRELKEFIDSSFQLENSEISNGELQVKVQSDCIREFLLFLRDNQKYPFQILIDICAVDYPWRTKRFSVVYNLLSVTTNVRIMAQSEVAIDEIIGTASDIYSSAGWYEREAWDMYGIMFADHPDLRRILTDYGFKGHPMRKDFPLTGFVEVRYDIDQQKVVYEKVKLTQDFRNFDFQSPWGGTEYILPGDEKATK